VNIVSGDGMPEMSTALEASVVDSNGLPSAGGGGMLLMSTVGSAI
jgi:hypothetical protein